MHDNCNWQSPHTFNNLSHVLHIRTELNLECTHISVIGLQQRAVAPSTLPVVSIYIFSRFPVTTASLLLPLCRLQAHSILFVCTVSTSPMIWSRHWHKMLSCVTARSECILRSESNIRCPPISYYRRFVCYVMLNNRYNCCSVVLVYEKHFQSILSVSLLVQISSPLCLWDLSDDTLFCCQITTRQFWPPQKIAGSLRVVRNIP